jgi:hypothetical protein
MDAQIHLTVVSKTYELAIQFYQDVLAIFSVYQDVKFGDNLRVLTLRYNIWSVPLILSVHLHDGPSYAEDPCAKRLFQLGLYHPQIDEVAIRLADNGFDVVHEVVRFGKQIRTADPYGNVIILSDELVETY